MAKSAVDILRDVADRVVVDADGNEETLRLMPPLSDDEFSRLADTIPCRIPPDADELLRYSRGIEGTPLESLDFSGLTEPIFEDLFPCGLPIAHDGYGNYWVVDLTSAARQWGPIFFACHDPPVIVYQCADVATFILDVLRLAEPPYGGPLDVVHEESSMRIWRDNPQVMSREEAWSTTDPVLKRFAEPLTDEHSIIDLRAAQTGDGFSWGRYGPQTPVLRAGDDRLFAYQRLSRGSRLLRYLRGGKRS